MEKELRNKFVAVTMTLMCMIFVILFISSNFYFQYWYNQDAHFFVKWIAESDVLLSEPFDSAGRKFIENSEEYNSVTAFIVSEDKSVLERLYDSRYSNSKKAENMIGKIQLDRTEKWKTGSYVYSVKDIGNGQYLVVMINTRNEGNVLVRIATAMIVIAFAFFMLLAITVYLSGFVTQPAKSAMLREKQFISDASHELKTPLGAISINAQALESVSGENKHLKNIINESERMSRLIERLLILSKLEENPSVPVKAFSLSECAEEMALTYESVAYDKGIEYTYDIPEKITLCGTDDDIRQIAAVLIDNAVKNTKKGGWINISLSENNGVICFKVENSGQGISDKDMPHIFERFYKSDNNRNSNSFGLGLAIARAASERNNGKIYAYNSDKGTTCFCVEFR